MPFTGEVLRALAGGWAQLFNKPVQSVLPRI